MGSTGMATAGGVPEGFPPAARPGADVVSSPRSLQRGNPSLSQLQSRAQDVFLYFL